MYMQSLKKSMESPGISSKELWWYTGTMALKRSSISRAAKYS